MNTAGPAINAARSRREPIRGGSVSRAIITIIHIAARIAPPWKAPPGVRADPEDLDADHEADGRQHPGEEDERGVGTG